jgi:hypothetical protein
MNAGKYTLYGHLNLLPETMQSVREATLIPWHKLNYVVLTLHTFQLQQKPRDHERMMAQLKKQFVPVVFPNIKVT